MHPEVVSDRPGSCPKCGMALEPRTAELDEEDEPGARRHDAADSGSVSHSTVPLLILAMAEMIPGQPLAGLLPAALAAVRRARPGHAGRALGRLAVLRAGLGLRGQPQPEHVHADRPGHRGGVSLQRGRHARPRHLPRLVAGPPRRGRRLLRGGRRHHHAGAPGPGAGAPRPRPDQRRHQGAARASPPKTARRRPRRRHRGGRAARSRAPSATGSGSGPARRCPWTASSSKGRARWTSR